MFGESNLQHDFNTDIIALSNEADFFLKIQEMAQIWINKELPVLIFFRN